MTKPDQSISTAKKQKRVLTSLRAETNSANIYSCGRVEKCTFKYFNTLTGFCRKMRIITLNSHFFSHLLLPDLHFPACTLTTWENLSGGIWLLTIIGIHPEKSSSYFKVQKDMFHFLLNKDKRQIWDEILSRRREAAGGGAAVEGFGISTVLLYLHPLRRGAVWLSNLI